jgi:hypothetical protein
MLKAFFTALMETIAKVVKELIREDTTATDAETPKDTKKRWRESIRDKLGE